MDTLKAISKAQRDAIDASDFAGPARSFPCDTRAHARAAIRLYGKADDPAKVKAGIIRILKRKGWADLIPDAWGATKDMDMPDLIHMGGSVKALGNGKVAGYLVVYGDETKPDLSAQKDFFTADTDYGLEDGMKSAVYYAHGLDATLKTRRLTNVTMKADEVGVWVEGQMLLRDEYEKAVYKMAEDGKLGWSSGTASHLVTRKAIKTDSGTVHEVLTWPLGIDASLTPTPAEPRAAAYTIKSLRDALFPPPAEDHTAKALPSGMSYDDLRAFLSDELNEDFPDTDDDGSDPWGPGLHVRDVYDDNLIYADEEDLYRIPYKVTPGNDVVWGTPESVVRTTVYVTATDGDDDAADTPTVPMSGMMAGKQADVAALRAGLRASMTLDDHASIVQDAMEGFAARAESLCDLTAIKAGRAMSASRHAKLTQIHAGMTTAHNAMAGHLQAINDMLLSTNPDAKKDAEELDALRTQSLRLQSAQLRMTG